MQKTITFTQAEVVALLLASDERRNTLQDRITTIKSMSADEAERSAKLLTVWESELANLITATEKL